MLNKYPLWKTLMVALIVALGALYATPNLYGEDPAVQVSGLRGVEANVATLDEIKGHLSNNNIDYASIVLEQGQVLTRFKNTEDQLKARDVLDDNLGNKYSVALNLTPATPDWLSAIGGTPMKLGLDLSGGVSFLMEVNMNEAINKAKDGMVGDFRGDLLNEKIRYRSVKENGDAIVIKFRKIEDLELGESLLKKRYRDLLFTTDEDTLTFSAQMTDAKLKEIREYALQQNITIIRNRVNELGVAEPLVQRQGKKHIVIELPGVQDTAKAKEILNATATIEFRLVDTEGDLSAALNGRIPPSSILLTDKDGKPTLLKKRIMLTGDHITDAKSGFDEYSRPQVNISLDSAGGSKMSNGTKSNIGKPMATVFIEYKPTDRRDPEGNIVFEKVQEVISVATIQARLGKSFRITGAGSQAEAHNLALLLRAGALIAPITIVEERTVGPTLGAENVQLGFQAIVMGFALVFIFMIIYYRAFGVVANLALGANLVLIVGIMSLIPGATLTLPGMAGIVLTVGMAVDANVLIFERIREEIREGKTIQQSIHQGYEAAFSTIIDANITTLIAALILFAVGTGPVKGFAVTLSIGIITSIFTSVIGSRTVVNAIWGGKRLEKLSIQLDGNLKTMQILQLKETVSFMKYRKIAMVFSALLMLASIASLAVNKLNFGLDFTGGTLIEVGFEQAADLQKLRQLMENNNHDDAKVQFYGSSRDVVIRLGLREDVKAEMLGNEILDILETGTGQKVDMRRIEFVGASVGDELAEQGGLAMLTALICILIYVAFRFEWRFAVGSVIALFHDVLLTLGLFSFLQLEFDLTVLAAILAVIGYSLNDTIVVSDRIRENFMKIRETLPEEIINISLSETLSRTIITSITTLLVLTALFLKGGVLIHGFATALLFGVFVGTYSSIYVASLVALGLGISREDLIPEVIEKEGEDQEQMMP